MSKNNHPQLLFADKNGKVFPFPGLEAAGMKAGKFFKLDPKEFVKLPGFSELFMLPDRHPVGFDLKTGEAQTLEFDPYSKSQEPCYAVASFIPPGYSITHNAAYQEGPKAQMLPLFSYGACVYYKDEFYVTAVRVDRHSRHDEAFMDREKILQNTKDFEKKYPGNRLIPHLAHCATVSACANAKNFFLERFEAPIPTSPACNAQCQGCISFQPKERIPSNQDRISFIPTPEEIAQISIDHLLKVENPIVSFGQGCEGEPTLAGDVIEKAIRMIRAKTSNGSLNLNTNASRPKVIEKLFSAGLNSMRVSLNSVREPYYSRYYQPKGYSLEDICASIRAAKKAGGFVSMNYLSMPGFTDSAEEFEALKKFLKEYKIDMIQWRNLNYDPLHYFRDLGLLNTEVPCLGIPAIRESLRAEFPHLLMGYFNPEKEQILQQKSA